MTWKRVGQYYCVVDPLMCLFANVIRHSWRRLEYEVSIADGTLVILIEEFATFEEAVCAAENAVIAYLLREPGAFGC